MSTWQLLIEWGWFQEFGIYKNGIYKKASQIFPNFSKFILTTKFQILLHFNTFQNLTSTQNFRKNLNLTQEKFTITPWIFGFSHLLSCTSIYINQTSTPFSDNFQNMNIPRAKG